LDKNKKMDAIQNEIFRLEVYDDKLSHIGMGYKGEVMYSKMSIISLFALSSQKTSEWLKVMILYPAEEIMVKYKVLLDGKKIE